MDVYDLLARRALPVALTPSPTSYFSDPHTSLDPDIFDGMTMRPAFRREQLQDVMRFLTAHWSNPETWCHLWLAGSSASYQWADSVGRERGDLDLLIGVEYQQFRRANPGFTGVSDEQISRYMNQVFQAFNGPYSRYDRTLYSNPGATDIRSIHPYAAYDIREGEWTVPPDPDARAPHDPVLAAAAAKFTGRASVAVGAYSSALDSYKGAQDPARRLNAAIQLRHAADAAASLYEEVHHGRRLAFTGSGLGYSDPHQYLWAAGKASGAVGALRAIADERKAVYDNPDADVDRVLLEAALYRRAR